MRIYKNVLTTWLSNAGRARPSRARLTGGPSRGHRGACGHICHRAVAGVHRDGLPGDFRVTVPAAGISQQRSLDAGDFIAGKSR